MTSVCFCTISIKWTNYNNKLTGKLGPAYCRSAGTGGGGYLCCGGPEVAAAGEVANLCAILASKSKPGRKPDYYGLLINAAVPDVWNIWRTIYFTAIYERNMRYMLKKKVPLGGRASRCKMRNMRKLRSLGVIILTTVSLHLSSDHKALCTLLACASFSSALKMASLSSSETSVNLYQTTWCHISEDGLFLTYEFTEIILGNHRIIAEQEIKVSGMCLSLSS